MPRFYIFRRGYNTANNPSRGGGPETVRVAEVEAADAKHAVTDALKSGITCYPNQTIWAEDAQTIDAEEAALRKRVRRLV